MTDDAATQLMDLYDRWDSKANRDRFRRRMEHKLNAKREDRNHRRNR